MPPTPTAQYRPRVTGNPVLDEGLRKAFDYIYALRDQVSKIPPPSAPLPSLGQLSSALQQQGVGSSGGGTVVATSGSPLPPLVVYGTLGIGSNLAPLSFFSTDLTATAVIVNLKQAPVGANLTLNINVAGSLWLSLTVLVSTTTISATSAQVAALTVIPAGSLVTLDLIAVGTTFPGSDLVAIIYA